ncbi:MAG TPA: hypothetical protein VEL07_02160 [Planctomycetota bacterium]|nr:hypothetical protein [Planctomycetota bacterium]
MSRLAALALISSFACAGETHVAAHALRWRFGGEVVRLHDGEDMGLAHALVDVLEPVAALPGLYVGLGGFGAVTGERGGFFTLGGALGWRAAWRRFELDVGGFAGGGGGGDAEQGGGLMLRPHAGIGFNAWRDWWLRGEVAHVAFPNGDIESTGVAIGIAVQDGIVGLARAGAVADLVAAATRRTRLAVTASWWRPCGCDGPGLRSGEELEDDLALVGVRLERFVTERVFLALVADGALGGGIAGYMDVFGGVGYEQPLIGPLSLQLVALGGAGGGGDVDTGGGLLLQPRAALVARHRGVVADVGVGRVVAPDGELSADAFALGVAWESDAVVLPRGVARARVAGADGETWHLSVINKTYLPRSSAHRANGDAYADDIELVGVGLEKPLTSWLSATGRGFAAWRGGAGGYAEGLVGLTAHADAWPRVALIAALEGGAAGGGGIEVDSGVIGQATVGARVAATDRLAIGLELGAMDALRGSFAAAVLALSLTWTFDRAVSAGD